MRLLLRLLAGIWLATLVVTGSFAYLEIREERTRLEDDLVRRAVLTADAVREATERVAGRGPAAKPALDRIVKRFSLTDRTVAIYDELGGVLNAAPEIRGALGPVAPLVSEAIRTAAPVRQLVRVGMRPTLVQVMPLERDERVVGAIAVLLDAEGVETHELALWQRTAVRLGVLILLLTGITWVLVRWTVTRPIARMAEWTKQLKTGQPVAPPSDADASLFGPLAGEVTGLARTLTRVRAAAEREARLRLRGESVWTEERLKQFVQMRFGASPIFVLSNREPVSHVRDGAAIRELQPASGLVTAMAPIMFACGGVWVAHGSGDADRIVGERIGLPADDPAYTLRRVWLEPDEEAGYYYGFANEGLWPLCHIVHERPQFRAADWAHYRAVNEKFAATVLEEMERVESPVVLVQDYHFALASRYIKRERPDARVALFWHIPWPNFEAFGICPWQEEILLGMLGADLVGFHTQYHCNNFLETVDRTLEPRIDWEHFAVTRGERVTAVKPFPISVAPEFVDDPPQRTREELRRELGISAEFLGVGVERVDYTKGLPERFRALQWFFERYPEYRERVVFVQLGAPSRTSIKRYAELALEVEATVREVNQRLGTKGWRPIVYLSGHHEHREVWSYYRHADFCMVTSLHDGMNLVAKEFVSVRDDEDGVLILSRFAGASHELRDALIINPYDLAGTAEAIRTALRSEEHTSELQSRLHLVCRLLLEKKKKKTSRC